MAPRMATLLALAGAILPASGAGAQTPPAGSTYVIVHGAWGGSWDWRVVDRMLSERGHRVFRPDLTGLGKRSHLLDPEIGLDTHITDIVNEILWEDLTDVILIGHSYGGMVITGVADSIPDRIRELIYVDAFLPEPGESVMALLGEQATAFRQSIRNGAIVPAWEQSDTIPRDVPQPARTFTDPLRLSGAYAAVPARYILTSEPERQPDTFQRYADRAARRGIEVMTMETGHVPQRTMPAELVGLILGRAAGDAENTFFSRGTQIP